MSKKTTKTTKIAAPVQAPTWTDETWTYMALIAVCGRSMLAFYPGVDGVRHVRIDPGQTSRVSA